MRVTAVQIPRPQQLGEADVGPKGLRHPRPCRRLLLPHIFQHRRRLPRQHCRLHHPQLLLAERPLQRQQGRRHTMAHRTNYIATITLRDMTNLQPVLGRLRFPDCL
jgi:hypothetical protein